MFTPDRPLIVYTAVAGDSPDRPGPAPSASVPTRYICFSDTSPRLGPGWECLAMPWLHASARRMARYVKLLPHRLFPDAPVTVWHDATHRLLVDPAQLIQEQMTREADLFTFRHPERRGVYEEADTCIAWGKDDVSTIKAQMERYRHQGHPRVGPLFETSVLLRRQTPDVAALCEAWWEELVQGSLRDQLSLPYAIARRSFSRWAYLPGSRVSSPWFVFTPHPPRRSSR